MASSRLLSKGMSWLYSELGAPPAGDRSRLEVAICNVTAELRNCLAVLLTGCNELVGCGMLKDRVRRLVYESLSLDIRKRLACSLLNDVVQASSKDDIALLEYMFASLDSAQALLEDRIRQIKFSGRTVSSRRTPMPTWLMEARAPWLSLRIDLVAMPGMISYEETQYYEYIGTFYEGKGDTIELGPWLGKSTRHIVRGLQKSPFFANKTLHVFDDFVWRSSWMDRYAPEDLRPPNHANFRPIFEQFVQDILPNLTVTRARIADHDGNENLPRIEWHNGPIEIMYIDCGRTIQVNEGWFEIFSPAFVPDLTLLIMQDWRTHRDRPRMPYNETLWFTNAHPEMELIHEVKEGGIATFLYRGTR